jgi:hypothetical protein
MNTEDNEMIQTPWGKKRWSTIRQAFEQRDELLDAVSDILGQLEAVGLLIDGEDCGQWHGAEGLSFAKAREAIAKAAGEPVMAA